MKTLKNITTLAITYSICNALMIVAIRELYTGDYLTFTITATISTVAYAIFLFSMYLKEPSKTVFEGNV